MNPVNRSQAASSLALLILALHQIFESAYVLHSDHDDQGFCLAALIPKKVNSEFLFPLQETLRSLMRQDLPFRTFSMTSAVLLGYLQHENILVDAALERAIETADSGEVLDILELGKHTFCTLKKETAYVESSSSLKWNELISLECVEIRSQNNIRDIKNSFCVMIRGVVAVHSKEARKKKKAFLSWYDNKVLFKKMSELGLWATIEEQHSIDSILENEDSSGSLFSHRVVHGPSLTKRIASVPVVFNDYASVWQLPISPYATFLSSLCPSAEDVSIHVFREWSEFFKSEEKISSQLRLFLEKGWLYSPVSLVLTTNMISQDFLPSLSTQMALSFYKKFYSKEEFIFSLHEEVKRVLKNEFFSNGHWDPSSVEHRLIVSPRDSYVLDSFKSQSPDGIISGIKSVLSKDGSSAFSVQTSDLLRRGELMCVFSVRKLDSFVNIDIQSVVIKTAAFSKQDRGVDICVGSICIIPCLSVEKWSALSLF